MCTPFAENITETLLSLALKVLGRPTNKKKTITNDILNLGHLKRAVRREKKNKHQSATKWNKVNTVFKKGIKASRGTGSRAKLWDIDRLRRRVLLVFDTLVFVTTRIETVNQQSISRTRRGEKSCTKYNKVNNVQSKVLKKKGVNTTKPVAVLCLRVLESKVTLI